MQTSLTKKPSAFSQLFFAVMQLKPPTHLLRVILILLALVFIDPSIAFANAGVPMIFLTVPGMAICLIPIIVLESSIIKYSLAISLKQVVYLCAIANILSTFIGVPIAWGLHFIIEIIVLGGISPAYESLPSWVNYFLALTVGAPWLAPDERNLYWTVPVATLVLLIPAYFISFWIELKIIRGRLSTHNSDRVRQAVRKANMISYFCLAGIVLALLIVEVYNNAA